MSAPPTQPSDLPPPQSRERGVASRLVERGCEFDFFQAVWLLERLSAGRSPVGGRGPVTAEPMRFRPAVSLAFPSTDVRGISVCEDPDGKRYHQMEVTFLGLYGVATPLPLHYAVEILRSVENVPAVAAEAPGQVGEDERNRPPGSTPVRDFLDLLHHRLISLFYCAWTKYRYHCTFGSAGRDVLTRYLTWLLGCSPAWDQDALGVAPLRMIHYAGALSQRPRSAAMLEGLLLDYWKGLPAKITQGVGRWVALQPDDRNQIGVLNSQLGTDLTVGEEVYDLSGAFRITLGPMDWKTYESFLPRTSRYQQTRSLVRLFCGDRLSSSIELKLREREVPEMKLCSGERCGRLGFTSWVRTEEVPEASVTFEFDPWNG